MYFLYFYHLCFYSFIYSYHIRLYSYTFLYMLLLSDAFLLYFIYCSILLTLSCLYYAYPSCTCAHSCALSSFTYLYRSYHLCLSIMCSLHVPSYSFRYVYHIFISFNLIFICAYHSCTLDYHILCHVLSYLIISYDLYLSCLMTYPYTFIYLYFIRLSYLL